MSGIRRAPEIPWAMTVGLFIVNEMLSHCFMQFGVLTALRK